MSDRRVAPQRNYWETSEGELPARAATILLLRNPLSVIRQIGAALGVSAFVLAATVGGFRLGLLLMIAVSAGTFACVLALPAHSLPDAHQFDPLE
jgi:hypothetical protein